MLLFGIPILLFIYLGYYYFDHIFFLKIGFDIALMDITKNKEKGNNT